MSYTTRLLFRSSEGVAFRSHISATTEWYHRDFTKILILVDSNAAIAAVKKAGRTGKARSRHLQEVVNRVAEIKERGGEVRLGWVKSYIGILGNEAADVCAKDGIW